MRKLRWALALPLYALQMLVLGVGYMLYGAGKLSAYLCRGTKVHVWWIKPATRKERELADKDERLFRIMCTCGKDDCKFKGVDRYVEVPLGVDRAELERAFSKES